MFNSTGTVSEKRVTKIWKFQMLKGILKMIVII